MMSSAEMIRSAESLVSPENADVVVLGMLPPPVTGAARNTQVLIDELVRMGVRTAALSTSISSDTTALRRTMLYHVKRMFHAARTALALRRGRKQTPVRPTLYMVPDGGGGIIYSALYAAISQSRYAQLFLHHHAFQYIDEPNRWMRLICKIFAGRITHIFLSNGMRDRFEREYGRQRSLVAGNARYAALLQPEASQAEFVIGHLSNLAALKGFNECVETYRALKAERIAVRLLLAGPVHDESISATLNEILRQDPDSVEYLGPVFGDEKAKFYRRISVFLFPTKWPQEAQPHVVYEALFAGVPVVAYGRGAIHEMIPSDLGLVIRPTDDFVLGATSYIKALMNDPGTRSPVARFHTEMRREAEATQRQHEELLALIAGRISPSADWR